MVLEVKNDKVLPVDLATEMKHSYIDYAMSVIIARALPDVRDGLKPVHRRILYTMQEAGMGANKPYKKSARIVGDVLGKYHPHGDSSVYDAIVRMAQDFSIRYMLVDGHGNFGSVDGDPPAAMRYTEVRMAKVAELMLADMDKDTVDFVPNYDESLKEPSVLPAKFPQLLVNGSAGIAVGMATNIPPHNMKEVIDGVLRMIEKPDVTVDELLPIIKGPDFPTGAFILGTKGIEEAYRTGRGVVKMRAVAEIDTLPNGKPRIIVTELPYQVNKARLVENIAQLVRDKTLEGITDLRDESDRSGMRIVIELRRDVNASILLNQLYQHTKLQESFGIIFLALVDGHPRVLNLREILYYYLEHQKEVVRRKTVFDLKKAEKRAHILEGLLIALDHLDAVINTIRASKTTEIAKTALIEKFSLTEEQAQAILDLRLQRLTGLEREKIGDEYQELVKLIASLKEILADGGKILAIIKEELLNVKKMYGDERRTRITFDAQEMETEDLIFRENIVITLTHNNYIKRMPIDVYPTQKRGGRGMTGMGTKEEDFVENILITTTHHTILFFTSKGLVYRLKGYEIPEASRKAKGTAILNLLELTNNEKITAIIPVADFSKDKYLFMATKKGIVKKTPLHEYANIRKNGLIALNLDEDNELIGVKLTTGKQNIMLGTKHGKAIVFTEDDVRSMGRFARGVKGIRLKDDDEVIGMDELKDGAEVLTVTEEGYGKRTKTSEYNIQGRGGTGIFNHKVTKKTGAVIGLRITSEEDELMLISTEGVIIRVNVSEVSIFSRNTQGVKIMKTDTGDKVASFAIVKEENLSEE